MFAGDYEPYMWMKCDGRLMEISEYQALHSILKNTYGGSEEEGNFALPRLTSETEGISYIICVNGLYPSRD